MGKIKFDAKIGEKYGHLTIIKEVPKRHGIRRFICKCDCGNPKNVLRTIYTLHHGTKLSCGCASLCNLKGKIFGHLKVLNLDRKRYYKTHRGYWLCKCKCGTVTSVIGTSLVSGKTKSCGCLSLTNNLIDLTGKRYGEWTVLKKSSKNYGGGRKWVCRCNCGKIREIAGDSLKKGRTLSCGCNRPSSRLIAGMKIGALTIKKITRAKGIKKCQCVCECEKRKTIRYNDIGKRTFSCGCYKGKVQHERHVKRALSFIGQKFGSLTVTKVLDGTPLKVMTICDCGCKEEVKLHLLTSNRKIFCKNRCDLKQNTILKLYNSVKNRSKEHLAKKGLRFSLSFEEYQKIYNKPCIYCGKTPSSELKINNRHGLKILYSSLDRIDSNKDYTITNVVPCCTDCNISKNDLNLITFLEQAKKIAANERQILSTIKKVQKGGY